MNDNKSKEYILLTNLELKIDVLPCCPCLLSLNAMSLSLAVEDMGYKQYSAYGSKILATVSQRLTARYGKGLYLAI